jgi:hypothetical protein
MDDVTVVCLGKGNVYVAMEMGSSTGGEDSLAISMMPWLEMRRQCKNITTWRVDDQSYSTRYS